MLPPAFVLLLALQRFALPANPPGATRQAMLNTTNQERAERGLAPLTWSSALAAAAREHAQAMVRAGTLSHQVSGEPNLQARASAQGAHFYAVAENIAYGPSAEEIEQGWMHSAPHRANILDPRMNRVGISLVAGGGELWAVEDFAAASADLQPGAVEQIVERQLQADGLSIAPSGSAEGRAARAACPLAQGGAGGQARLIVHWESSNLHALPRPLMEAIRSKRYTRAAVGACPAISPRNASFTAFRVAVLLF